MADHLFEPNGDRKRRLSGLILTRSPSSHGEIHEENIAERDVDDRKRDETQVERGDTSEVDQEG
ncbi:MAG TPA: hypothetical protein VFO29_07250 [Candidatus Rubrimentiphilum sp.]|nr:hypothetical protein [Candidatus Rubrimentiphilum sp.]